MFQGLRQNSIFYVLDKSGEPTLKIGQVINVSNPQPKFPSYQPVHTPLSDGLHLFCHDCIYRYP